MLVISVQTDNLTGWLIVYTFSNLFWLQRFWLHRFISTSEHLHGLLSLHICVCVWCCLTFIRSPHPPLLIRIWHILPIQNELHKNTPWSYLILGIHESLLPDLGFWKLSWFYTPATHSVTGPWNFMMIC